MFLRLGVSVLPVGEHVLALCAPSFVTHLVSGDSPDASD